MLWPVSGELLPPWDTEGLKHYSTEPTPHVETAYSHHHTTAKLGQSIPPSYSKLALRLCVVWS